MARRLSVLIWGKLWKDVITMLVYGSDPAPVLLERRKSRGRSTWMSKIGSPSAILSTCHLLHAGHQGYAAEAATTKFISNSSQVVTLISGQREFSRCV
jgi:hypothetical protein